MALSAHGFESDTVRPLTRLDNAWMRGRQTGMIGDTVPLASRETVNDHTTKRGFAKNNLPKPLNFPQNNCTLIKDGDEGVKKVPMELGGHGLVVII